MWSPANKTNMNYGRTHFAPIDYLTQDKNFYICVGLPRKPRFCVGCGFHAAPLNRNISRLRSGMETRP